MAGDVVHRRVVTFYSFKGGVGRSMALANVGMVLASAGKKVLMVDWDLEAPGLHEFFRPWLRGNVDLASQEGVMDLLWSYALASFPSDGEPFAADWYLPYTDISSMAVEIDLPLGGGRLALVTAGRQTPYYGTKVRTFDWSAFFDRLGGSGFLYALRQNMLENFEYVLIDARTGVSEVAEASTLHMPDVVVNCFTLSRQSIHGACNLTKSIRDARKDLTIFPVPMRVDRTELARAELARAEIRERFFDYVKNLDADPTEYWMDVEVPYDPRFSFEEVPAALQDQPDLRSTVLHAAENLCKYITAGDVTRMGEPPEAERGKLLTEILRSGGPAFSHVVVSGAERDADWRDWLSFVLERAGFTVMEHDASNVEPQQLLADAWTESKGHLCVMVLDSPASRDLARVPFADKARRFARTRVTPAPSKRRCLQEIVVSTSFEVGDVAPTALDIGSVGDERVAERRVLELFGVPFQHSAEVAPPSRVDRTKPGYPGIDRMRSERLDRRFGDRAAALSSNFAASWRVAESDPQQAVEELIVASRRASDDGDRYTAARSFLELGRIELGRDNSADARTWLRRCLEITTETSVRSSQGQDPLDDLVEIDAEACLLMARAVGEVSMAEGKFYLDRALRAGRLEIRAQVHLERGRTAEQDKRHDDAYDEFVRAEYLFDEIGNRGGLAMAYVGRSAVAGKAPRFGDASQFAEVARTAAADSGSWETQFDVLDQLAMVARDRREFARARELCVEAMETLPQDSQELLVSYLGDRGSWNDARRHETAGYRKALRAAERAWPCCLRLAELTRDAADAATRIRTPSAETTPRGNVTQVSWYQDLPTSSRLFRLARFRPSTLAVDMLRRAYRAEVPVNPGDAVQDAFLALALTLGGADVGGSGEHLDFLGGLAHLEDFHREVRKAEHEIMVARTRDHMERRLFDLAYHALRTSTTE